ncbi:transglutaminase domain-containing protein [Armatimonas sp.]|uniref:transglutaminase domain-containing protein n=1 Tax=Armatimonas sp. TaxID=1872638 RepID=UPI00374DCBC7
MKPSSPQLPIPVALFALVCLLSLFLTSGGTLWLAAALGVLVLASYVLNLRLPTTWLPSLLFGGILLALAILSTPQDGPGSPSTIIPPRPIFLFGQAAAILMTLQFYRPTPKDPTRPRLFALLGGTLLLIAASSTFDEGRLGQLIPALVVLLGISLRALRGRHTAHRLTFILLGTALVGSLGVGWLGVKGIRDNREKIMEWGNRLMSEHPPLEQLGMSQQPTLGNTFGARGSNARVLRLEGTLRSSHLRGAAFDTYSENRWGPPLNIRTYDPIEAPQLNLPLPRGVLSNSVSATRLQSGNPVVFFPLETFSLELGAVEQTGWARDASGPVRVRVAQPYTYSYRESTEGAQGLMALPGLRSKAEKERYLQLPENLPKLLVPLAKKITKDASTPAQKVDAVTRYLLENYPYSLTFDAGFLFPKNASNSMLRFVEGKRSDFIARFLLSEPKAGAHCEFFASGAALLLRCVGVPTRYVTGYFAHEQEGPDTLLVRQRDAHAWCEAWVEGKGWITVEATPPTGWPEQNKAPMEPWRRAWEWLEDRWLGLLSWLAETEPTQLALTLLLPFGAIGLGALWQYRKRPSRAALTITTLAPPPELATLAKRFEAALHKSNLPPAPSQPWSEQLPALPEAAQPAARQFVTLYQTARFGGKSADRDALEQALQTVEEALTKHYASR